MDKYFKKTLALVKKVPSLKPEWFWVGFFVGLSYFGIVFGWLWSLHPLATIGITSSTWSFIVVLFVYAGSVLPAAACWGLLSWLINRIYARWGQHGATSFFFGGLFVTTEYVRAWVFGMVWIGSGSSLGPDWTFGNPGYWLTAFSPLAQSASWWGMYGIDFVLAILITTLLFLYKHPAKRQLNLSILVTTVAVCVGSIIIGTQPTEGDNSIPVALIQTSKEVKPAYSGDEAFKDAQQKLKLVKEAAQNFSTSGGIILLPEGAAFSTFLNTILTASGVQDYFRRLGPTEILLVDNVKTETSSGLTSRVVMVSSRDGLIASNDKHTIAPGGEYLPFLARGFLAIGKLFGLNLAHTPPLSSGSTSFTTSEHPVNASFVACSDVLSPALVRNKDSAVILGVNSLGLFKGNAWLSYQLLAANKMRAIENRSWLAWASNFGESYIIDSGGKTALISKKTGYGILTGSVVPRKQPAWYTYVGDWPVLLVSFALVGISLRRRNAS